MGTTDELPQPQEPNRNPPFRSLPAKIVLVFLGIAAALLLLEGMSRLLIPNPYAPRSADGGRAEAKGLFDVRCDRLLGWRGIPFHDKNMDTDGYKHRVVLNSRGMHDTEHDVAKPEGMTRILVLGDSFVEAEQVTQAETAAQVLEDALNERPDRRGQVEVIAAGAGGWGAAQELMYYRSEGRLYQPDVVLVFAFLANDLQDSLPDARRTGKAGINCYSPYFVTCAGASGLDPHAWFSVPGLQPTWNECSAARRTLSAVLGWLYAHSHLYQVLEPLTVPGQPRLELKPMYAPWLETAQADPLLVYAYDLNAGIYTRLTAEAQAGGARVAFVLVPLREEVLLQANPDETRIPAPVADADRGHIDPTLPNRTMSSRLAAAGLTTLDLLPVFSDYVTSGHPVPYGRKGDFHWDADGNRLAAHAVADWLVTAGWIE